MEHQIEISDILNFLIDVKSTKKFKRNEISDKINLNYLEFFNSKNFMHFSEILFDYVDRIGIHTSKKNSVYLYLLVLIIFSYLTPILVTYFFYSNFSAFAYVDNIFV